MLTVESGTPQPVGIEGLEMRGLSEEHGNLIADPSVTLQSLGDTIELLPTHCCTTVNLHDRYYAVRIRNCRWMFAEMRLQGENHSSPTKVVSIGRCLTAFSLLPNRACDFHRTRAHPYCIPLDLLVERQKRPQSSGIFACCCLTETSHVVYNTGHAW